MKINRLFKNSSEITIHEFLSRCGVSNPEKYLKAKTIEDTSKYDNIDEAKSLILSYLKSPIYILVDCDVDGFFSASLLYLFLKRLNINAKITPMIHNTKIHGLTDKEILSWLKTKPKGLIITPDSSVNDTKECKELSELGFKILIGGEHHLIENYNPYATIVSNQIGNIDNRHGSGGLVTWHMCRHIDRELVKDLISYVAISLIGDSMDMTSEENYTFTKWGKERIHHNLIPFVEELNRDGDTISCRSYSFGIVTCINSLIRLGTLEDKQELFSALCGEIDTTDIIAKCKKYHTQQQTQSKKMVDDVDIINNSSVVIGRLPEKTTMTGLIAGKLMSKYGKPILLGRVNEDNGEFSGSVRSPIDFKDILADSGLTNFQTGHSRAYGFGYPLSNEQAIIDYLDSVVSDCEPYTDVLCSCRSNTIPNSLFSFVESYKHIFSKGLDTYNVHIQPFTIYNTDIQTLGKGNTIKFNKDGIDFISFFTSNEMKERLYMNVDEKVKLRIECICELCYNEFRGRKSKQCVIDKIECTKVDEEILDWSKIWG